MSMYRFGKHPPRQDYRTLRLKTYFTAALAPPPVSYEVLDKVCTKLNVPDVPSLFPLDANDSLGDCTIAALAHAITAYCGLVGTKKIMSVQAVTKLHLRSCANSSPPRWCSWACHRRMPTWLAP